MEALRIGLARQYKVLMVVAFFFSFGLLTLILWLVTWRWPRILDSEGVTLRNGNRLLWKDLTRVQPVTVVNRYGSRVTGRIDLHFGKNKVPLVGQSLKEGALVFAFVGRVLGQDIVSG